jgi:uncharacterized RDD family membrane protein YckC
MDESNPYAPPQAAVYDVPAPPQEWLEPADRVTRLAASILDGVIIFVMVYVPLLMAAAASGAADSGSPIARGVVVLGGFLTLAGLATWIVLTIRSVSRNGQSLAKEMLGIRVVRTDGTPASLGRIFWLRNVVNYLLSIIPLYGFVDVLFIFGESRQCLHDKLADTAVVKA